MTAEILKAGTPIDISFTLNGKPVSAAVMAETTLSSLLRDSHGLNGVKIACAKRPVSAHDMEGLIDDIEDAFSRQAGVEIPSVKLGALVMELLAPLDRVAFVRYASVYRNFQDAGEFQEFVDEMASADAREEQRRNQVELPI